MQSICIVLERYSNKGVAAVRLFSNSHTNLVRVITLLLSHANTIHRFSFLGKTMGPEGVGKKNFEIWTQ
jgi:hypothetical protein